VGEHKAQGQLRHALHARDHRLEHVTIDAQAASRHGAHHHNADPLLVCQVDRLLVLAVQNVVLERDHLKVARVDQLDQVFWRIVKAGANVLDEALVSGLDH